MANVSVEQDFRERLRSLVSSLSNEECAHLIPLFERTRVGDNFWEEDPAIFYNEYVKTRQAVVARDPTNVLPSVPGDEENIYAPIEIERARKQGNMSLALPEPGAIAEGLTAILRRRRSRRAFSGRPLKFESISTLLQHAYGVTAHVRAYGYDKLSLHTAPTTGGLQSPEIYVFAQRIIDVPAGLYRFDSQRRALDLVRMGDWTEFLAETMVGQPAIRAAGATVLIAGCYARLRWKYGARSYRYMCVDIGCVLENLLLTAEALQLAACPVAAFVEDTLEHVLEIDGMNEMAIVAAVVGCSD